MIKRFVRYYFGLLYLLVALGINYILSLKIAYLDKFYTHFFFPSLRVLHDYTFGLVPVPSLYLILICLTVWMGYLVYRIGRRQLSFKKVIRGIINFICVLIAFFYTSWAHHYITNDIRFIDTEKKVRAGSKYLIDELNKVEAHLDSLRKILEPSPALEISRAAFGAYTETDIRYSQEALLKSWKWPIYGRVRVRRLKPDGLLLRLSTSGIYIPHSFEGHLDNGLYIAQHPFTMAHEMAHGYGFTDEGICNFIGFLTCLNMDDPLSNYSALLAYWRYLIRDLRKSDRCLYDDMLLNMSAGLRTDLNSIYTVYDKYPDLFPNARNVIYDSYLKAHGVADGMISYSQMTAWVYQWKEKNAEHPIYEKWFK